MRLRFNPIANFLDYVLSSIGELTDDVDILTTPPVRDDVMKWNGTKFVPAVYSTTFAMTILTFVDNQANEQLIGASGDIWKTTGNISFTASYNNPPPASASIAIGGTGGVTWVAPITLTTPFTSGASVQNTVYPTGKDTTVVFTLTAYDGATPRTDTETVTFRNNIKWGPTMSASGWDSVAINALGSTLLSNVYSGTFATTCASGNYILFAHPSSYSTLHDDGFLYNSITCPFESPVTVSVTNTAGKTEDYKVYRSTNQSLGDHNLYTDTKSNLINPFYYGGSDVSDNWTESQIKLLTDVKSPVQYTTIGTWSQVTLGSGEYFIFAYPSRLINPTNWYDNTSGLFLSLYASSPKTVSITNANGYTEDYKVWRSNQILGPGNFTLRTT